LSEWLDVTPSHPARASQKNPRVAPRSVILTPQHTTSRCPGSVVRALVRQRRLLVRSSGGRCLVRVVGRHPQPPGSRSRVLSASCLPPEVAVAGERALNHNDAVDRAYLVRSTAVHAAFLSTPLYMRADPFTPQLPRAEAQQPSEQSTGGWWAEHGGDWLTCHCAEASEQRAAACIDILPDNSVTFPTNHRIHARPFGWVECRPGGQ